MDKLIIIRTDNQNNLYEQIISLITANQAKMETMSFGVFPTLFFPGLEIRQHQRRVFRDGEEINLTRLEYSTLVFLASNPGNVLTQEQIFEAVWNMDSDSCHSSVVNDLQPTEKDRAGQQKPHLHKDRFRHRLQVCFRGMTTE